MSDPGPRFRPPLWASLATLLLAALFVALGSWQLSRAREKREFFAAFEAGLAATPVTAPAGAKTGALRYASISATGRFDATHQVLLDARTRDGRAGYEVLTPLLREGAAAVLVNRGWVPAAPDRKRLPGIDVGTAPRTVRGLLDRLPQPAIASGAPHGDEAGGWPRRMLFPTTAAIAAATGYPVANYQLLLAPGEADGFARDWRPAVMTPEQHLGYAVQWFALATALVVIYVALNLRRTPRAPPPP